MHQTANRSMLLISYKVMKSV